MTFSAFYGRSTSHTCSGVPNYDGILPWNINRRNSCWNYADDLSRDKKSLVAVKLICLDAGERLRGASCFHSFSACVSSRPCFQRAKLIYHECQLCLPKQIKSANKTEAIEKERKSFFCLINIIKLMTRS